MNLRRSQRGISLMELMVVLGMSAIVLGAAGFAFNTLNSADSHLASADDLSSFRFVALRQIACEETVYPGGTLAAACAANLTLPRGSSCAGLSGLAIYRKAQDGTPKELLAASGRKAGDFELRSCCPGGQPRIEARQLNKAGTKEKTDQLTGKVMTWKSLFATDTVCGAVAPPPLSGIIPVTASVTLAHATPLPFAGANCPGYFKGQPGLSGPENQLNFYDGVATCPPGYRLIGGGVNCSMMGFSPYLPRSYVVDSHPQLKSSPTGKLGDSQAYFGSCCGHRLNALPKTGRVTALCEKL